MQVSLDGACKYAGHKIINYKDGRRFVSLNIIDEKGEPINIFCPGQVEEVLRYCDLGDPLSLVFNVSDFQNRLSLRCIEVIRGG